MLLKQRLVKLWPFVLKSTHETFAREVSARFADEVKKQVDVVRANADGLLAEYNKLEDRKNQFVDQNLKLRAALNESQEQVKNLTIALHTAEQKLAQQ